ncbi:MAG: cupin [Haloquadratum sp.]
MPKLDLDDARSYEDEQFAANELHHSDAAKVVYACFEPGQFIPVHAPESDVVVDVRSGSGIVREGEESHPVDAGEVVAVEAGVERGIRTGDERLETLLVTAPSPTHAEHEPVRRGLANGEFEPALPAETAEGDGR